MRSRVRNSQYGKRLEETCIELVDTYLNNDPDAILEHVLTRVSASYQVPNRTLRRWYNHLLEWGEPPHETRTKLKLFHKKSHRWRRTKVITDEIVDTLRDIIADSPELYIDEIADELAARTRVYLSASINCLHHPGRKTELFFTGVLVCYDSAG